MKLHLVGGFLGSGKTTAIASAVRLLQQKEIRAGVVTNDQGKYLVDTQYFQSLDIPASEVNGGCFCCHYNELERLLDRFGEDQDVAVIFAESVGSCTDLVATVLRPLAKFRGAQIEQTTFSTFVDARLLHRWLAGKPLPFHPDTNYIWEKQLEEAHILVVNKVDLLSADALGTLRHRVANRFSPHTVVLQNSLDMNSIGKWLSVLARGPWNEKHQTLAIDYDKYGAGEYHLAWLDESVEFRSENGSALRAATDCIDGLTTAISREGLATGHLKFMLYSNDRSYKYSVTALPSCNTDTLPNEDSARALLVINARIHTSPEKLASIVSSEVNAVRKAFIGTIVQTNLSIFRPGFPRPTHRIV